PIDLLKGFLGQTPNHRAGVFVGALDKRWGGLVVADFAEREDGGAASLIVGFATEVLDYGQGALGVSDSSERRHCMKLDGGFGGPQEQHLREWFYGGVGLAVAQDVDRLDLNADIPVGEGLDQDSVGIGVGDFTKLVEFADTDVRVGILESELHILEDFEGGFLVGARPDVIDARLDHPLMHHRAVGKRAAQSLAAIGLRMGSGG